MRCHNQSADWFRNDRPQNLCHCIRLQFGSLAFLLAIYPRVGYNRGIYFQRSPDMERLIEIRTAKASDLDAIARLEALCFPAAEAASRERFCQRLKCYADHFWLLFADGELVSFVDGFVTDCPNLTDEMFADATMHNPQGRWQMIFGVNTHPDFRGQGYAGRLLWRAIEDARSQNRQGLVLTCKDRLVSYYEGFGFVNEGISADSAHGGAQWYQLRLDFSRQEKNVLVLFPGDAPTRAALVRAGAGRFDFRFASPDWSPEDYSQAFAQAQILIGEPKADQLRQCKKLELLQSTSSGVNYFLQKGLLPENAQLYCMTGCYGEVLAEHMLGMTLALCRRLPEYRDQQHRHLWQLLRYDKQLSGSTVLILGAGDIGTTLARWMRPMVGKIIGMCRTPRQPGPHYDEMITLDALDGVLPQADIILCALPHTAQTIHLLDERRLRLMKPDAVLVNGGRGSLIEPEGLCRVLDDGLLWGVGLEVAHQEPLSAEDPLWDQPRVLITPHAAGNSFGPGSPLDRKLWASIIRNMEHLANGRPLDNPVDFATGYRRSIGAE